MKVERPFIRCKKCKLASYHPSDIEHRYCGMCDKFHEGPEDYELGTNKENASRKEIQAMAAACTQSLGPVELAIVAHALNDYATEFMREAIRHTGCAVSATTWAELVLSCARTTIVVKEIENVIKTYYAQEQRGDVRRALLNDRDPQLFGVLTKAVGTLNDEDWSALVLRCVGVALELSDGSEVASVGKWKLIGHDTFEGADYPLTEHDNEEEALKAAHERLRSLEDAQPSKASGGQDGIQDRVFVERPDGSRYRVTETKEATQ